MGEAPECPHGIRVYVSKLGDYGPWHAWGCPAQECNGENGSEKGLIFVKEPKKEGSK